ncbi:MAG TPA: hypothetical protein VGC37_20075 [Friedmanniella sp.]
MELSERLLAQLSLLPTGAERDGSALVDDLAALVTTLSEAVSGYAGLRLTLVHSGHPVQVAAMTAVRPGQEVVTSLRLALGPVSDAFEEGGRLVVWSTVPGALVDLAADLGYVFLAGGTTRSGPPVVDLDADLALPPTISEVTGLDELATIHRAVGLLIGRGHDPATVHQTLRDGADGDSTSTYAWAVRLLGRP